VNKNINITAGVKNLFDTKPPHTEQGATFQVGYDPRFADALLRAYYVRAQYKF
jgi:iron complex outermembrane receptor protein